MQVWRAAILVCFLPAFFSAPAAVNAACTGDVEAASKAFDAAARWLQKGNTEKAKTQLDQVLKLMPCFPQAHEELGHIAMKEQRFEDALRLYETARDDYAAAGDLLKDLQSKVYMSRRQRLNDLRSELSNLGVQAREGMSEQDVRQRRAELENRIRELDRMQEPVAAAPPEAPGEIYFHIGTALMRLGRNDEALSQWETCRSKAPDYGPVYNNLAVVYFRRGRLDDAWAAVMKAEELKVQVNPTFKADLERAMKEKGGS